MIKLLKKIILFLVAFNPMYLIFIVQSIIQIETSKELEWNGISHWFVFSLIVLFLITLLAGILYAFKKPKNTSVKINVLSAKNVTGNYFLQYFSLFGLLALSFDISKPYQLFVLLLIMLLLGIVYITNNLYYINPLFNLLGFKIINITYTTIEGTKIQEANIFTLSPLEKEVECQIEVEYSEYDFAKQIKQSNKKKRKI